MIVDVTRACCSTRWSWLALEACEIGNAEGNPGVWWNVPTSCIKQHCGDRATAEEAHWTQLDQEQYQSSGLDLDDDNSDIVIEIFNTSTLNAGLSIDGFDAELLGVLQVKLSDIWSRASSSQYRACDDKRQACDEIGSRSNPTQSSDSRSIAGTREDRNQPKRSHRRRIDRWFGGVVASSCSPPRGVRTRAANNSSALSVEARLEIIWGGTEMER